MNNLKKHAQNTFDQFIEKLEYYPSQLALDKNIFKFYTQQERAPQFFSIYCDVYIQQEMFSHDEFLQFLQAEPFQYHKIPERIRYPQHAFKINVLSAFKIYTMLQGNLQRKVEFRPDILLVYQRLDDFFSELKKQPLLQDLPLATRELSITEQVQPILRTDSMFPTVILALCGIVALLLTLLTSGMLSLLFQACLYVIIFLMAKSILSASREPDFDDHASIQHIYLRKLDHFFETMQLKLNQVNPH